ncbi:hypothetical protein [Sphingomonas sp. ID0503]|uniref:hypothetical protein n=1 Tax=Sphingomonas sp. ID0503 TaxID=3399691 RepID=UPI003AFB6A9C
MKTLAFAALTAAALWAIPAPAAAQAIERYVEVFGSDPCPVSGDGEIVVCARKPEGDRYRIPEKLRGEGSVANKTWAARASELEYVGASGAASCSASGQGGWTGCWSELMRQARAEAKQPAQNTTAASAK